MFEVWEETEALRVNRQKNRAEPRTSCKSTVLNTVPPCRPGNSTEAVRTSSGSSPAGDTDEEELGAVSLKSYLFKLLIENFVTFTQNIVNMHRPSNHMF